jgi:hypothetical protein
MVFNTHLTGMGISKTEAKIQLGNLSIVKRKRKG